jgi:hypothetical protein
MQRVTLEEFLKSISFSELAAQALREITGLEYATPDMYMHMLGLAEGSWLAHVFDKVKSEIRDDCRLRIAPGYKHFDRFKTKLSEGETHSLCAEATTAFGRRISELYGNGGVQWEMNVLPIDAHERFMEQFMESTPKGGFKELKDFAVNVDRELFLARMRNRLFDFLARAYEYS